MEQNFWDSLLSKIEDTFYTGGLWQIASFLTLVVGIKHYRKETSYNLFIIYTAMSFLISLPINRIMVYLLNFKRMEYTIYLETMNTLFALIEICAFLYFFMYTLKLKFIKQFVLLFLAIFIGVCILFFLKISLTKDITIFDIESYSYKINWFEFSILLAFCLLYFYQLLIQETDKIFHLHQSPSFWIVSGLFFYCIVSLPATIIGIKLLFANRGLYNLMGAVHYISISLLLLTLAKAFSCKKTLTT